MLFKELEGKEIIDKNGERLGFVRDIVFTTTGKITHLIAMPKGIITKMTIGQLNIQFEDVEAIDDIVMLNKTKAQLHGKEEVKQQPKIETKQPKRVLLKKKSENQNGRRVG